MKYMPPELTLEVLNSLPASERERVLQVVLKVYKVACEKIGFIVVGQNAVVMNEAPQSVRVPANTSVRTLADAERILNSLGVSTATTGSSPLVCKDLIIECLKSSGGADISELTEYVKNRMEVSDNSIRDSLWRLHKGGFVKKGAGRKPKYVVGRSMS